MENLNAEQKKAVETLEGPVLIVAGAGAGKTKTLVHRIAKLIDSGVDPKNILAVTFTNKAAKEMKQRVFDILKNEKKIEHNDPLICTFHSLGVRIIKENAPLLGLSKYFSIFDESDRKKYVKEALKVFGIEPKEYLDKITSIISNEKSNGVSHVEYQNRSSVNSLTEMVSKVWPAYENILKRDGGLDFDDLLLKSLFLLEKHPTVLDNYQKRFQYIHIDEYQDTNKVQDKIVKLLADKHKNICVVGDTDQNIYSWRGADISHMLQFEKNYPNATIIFLEQNYRSTKNILDAANSVIDKNKYRIKKNLFTKNDGGEKIVIYGALNELDEALFVAKEVINEIESGARPDEIAVLYRVNFQSRVLEQVFMSCKIPYQTVGTKFFERKEVKDFFSWLRLSLNPESKTDLTRALSSLPRGLGATTVAKIVDDKTEGLPVATKIKLEKFFQTIKDCREIIEKEKASVAIKKIIKLAGFEKYYLEKKSDDSEERFGNIMELVTVAVSYDELGPMEGIEKMLIDSTLMSDQDTVEDSKGVKLMTVHSSKGLEFDHVFVTGMEDGLFPHQRSQFSEKKEDREEERRLFYVAITRAGKKLFLTWAQSRTVFGNTEMNSPSEFLDDIPVELIKDDGELEVIE